MRKNSLFTVFIIACMVFTNSLVAQQVGGLVSDEEGSPLIGVSVILDKTYTGVVTGPDGRFSLVVPNAERGQLIFSYLGYQSQKVNLNDQQDLMNIEVVLMEDIFGIGELVVMARRREEDIRDVPMSITSLSSKQIELSASTSSVDIMNRVPNVYISEGQYTSSVNIRGILGGNYFNPGSGTAEGTYLNGVYMGPDEFQNNFVTDLQRLEVLRGPQGTQFGRNSISGAVNMISIKPTAQNYATINLDYGQRNYLRIRPIVNFKIADNLSARASIMAHKYDGYITNIALNQKAESKPLAGRIDFRYTPGERLAIDFGVDFTNETYNEQRPNIVSWANLPGTEIPLDIAFESLGLDLNDQGRGTFSHNTPTLYEKDLIGTYLNASFFLNDRLTLTSITSLRDANRSWSRDLDFSVADMFSEKREDTGRQFSEELRISSAGNDKFKWAAGVFYYSLSTTFDQQITLGSLIDVLNGLPPGTLAGYSIAPRADLGERSIGVFASADYQLSSSVFLNAGVRYSNDNKDIRFQQDGVPGVFPAVPDENSDFVADGFLENDYSQSVVNPTLSVKVKATNWANLYALYSSGYKAGGFNVRFITNAMEVQTPFNAERMNNYEIGAKLSNNKNSLFINLSAFLMKYKDLQVSVTLPAGQGIAINNAAKSDIKGIEADFTAIFLKHFALSGGLGLNDAKYTEYTYKLPDDTEVDLSGEKIANLPTLNSNVSLDLSFPIGGMKLIGRLQYAYRSELEAPVWIDELGTNTIDAVGLWNARLGMEVKDLGVYLWIRNLTDREYLISKGTSGLSPFVFTYEQIGEPRLIGLNLVYSIGKK